MASTKKWKDVFLDNYNGKSDVAKEVEPFIKENYKGNSYIPWATMERLTYMCDEDAYFETIKNENGGLVHTDKLMNYQKNIQKGETISETEAAMFSHFVKVKLVFMGKEFIEDFPIQDQDYTPARIYNQNLVNKALQRAKAKVASRATGIGLKLYEGKDLQFDEVPQETKPELPVKEVEKASVKEKKAPKNTENAQNTEKTVQKVDEKPIETPVTTQSATQRATQNTPINDAIDLIRNTDVDKMNLALQKINVSLMKKHKIAISTESTDEELYDLLSNKDIFKDPDQFLKTLKRLLGM